MRKWCRYDNLSCMSKHPLTDYREIFGLSQRELADTLGLTRWAVNAIENGRRQPSPILAVRIEQITGVPREDLRPDIFAREAAQ